MWTWSPNQQWKHVRKTQRQWQWQKSTENTKQLQFSTLITLHWNKHGTIIALSPISCWVLLVLSTGGCDEEAASQVLECWASRVTLSTLSAVLNEVLLPLSACNVWAASCISCWKYELCMTGFSVATDNARHTIITSAQNNLTKKAASLRHMEGSIVFARLSQWASPSNVSLGPPKHIPQMASQSVSHFCTVHGRTPSKLPLRTRTWTMVLILGWLHGPAV